MKRPATGVSRSGPSEIVLLGGERSEANKDAPDFQLLATQYADAAERRALDAFNASGPAALALFALAGDHARMARSFALRAGGAR